MNCSEITTYLIDYLDGTLSESQQSEIKQHLEHCPACMEEYIQTGQLFQMMDKTENKQPSDRLSENFYRMLNHEKAGLKKANRSHQKVIFLKQFGKYAALVVIFIGIGVLIGSRMGYRHQQSQQILTLQQQINQLTAVVNLTAQDQPSASQRLKAIQTTNTMNQPNDQVISALIKTMDNDESVNVRMAAMYALTRYSGSEKVKSAFVESLNIQTDPLLQITLINILVNLQDERAKQPIERILKNTETLDQVKETAEEGLKTFL